MACLHPTFDLIDRAALAGVKVPFNGFDVKTEMRNMH